MNQFMVDEKATSATPRAGLVSRNRREVRRSNSNSVRPGLFGQPGNLNDRSADGTAAPRDGVPPWGPERGFTAGIEMKLLIGTAFVSCGLLYGIVGSLFG